MSKATLLSRFLRSDDGTAIIEAALAIPIAIALTAGLVDFGRAYFTMASAQKNIRNAVRYLTTLPPAVICDWGMERAQNLVIYGEIENTGKPLINGWDDTEDVKLILPECPASSATIVRIEALVPYSPMIVQFAGAQSPMTFKVEYEARWIGG